MGGRSAPAPVEAKPIEPPKPVPLPDSKALPDGATSAPSPSYATTEAAREEEKNKGSLGATQTQAQQPRRPRRDAGTVANSAAGGSLGTSAVITG